MAIFLNTYIGLRVSADAMHVTNANIGQSLMWRFLLFGGGGWWSRSRLHHEFLVVSHGAKEGLVQEVPGHVLHHRRVACEDGLGVHDLALLGHRADVP